ncbi:polyprenyl synthetase family protein [Sediminibacillus dalangtanensis]|uniref:Polyprenyl synthetase family protein n=1 Tax=Sediminibacillus dalangtanensis TaxID=2729421 RepID=A0ABX7VTC4_9BACI|nr:farnesyl diphosphate synthase [Sediminibacillus dalangtanensis]QTM99783.1 polyprenyl synthetase family protein [Sediminibacillus dalangtanensis]
MTESLEKYLKEKQLQMDEAIVGYIKKLEAPERLKAAMKYSAEAGGKRLRPILMAASCESYGGVIKTVIPAAAALEMIHTYSLIHDDLPAMDNDNIRRGKPTNHIQFDEATAILAGDGLLTYSFEIIASELAVSETKKVELIRQLADAAGPKGMVAGQVLDMQAEDKKADLEQLEQIHTLKTGRLLRFAVTAGAMIGGATTGQIASLQEYAYYLGLIFQVQDDILDVQGDPELIGKPVGSDETNLKSTYPKLLGLDGAIQQKEMYIQKAKQTLKEAGVESSVLVDITEYFGNRDR